MADKNGLGLIGLMFGAATLLVMLIGGVVVTDHLNGTLKIDDGITTVALPSAVR